VDVSKPLAPHGTEDIRVANADDVLALVRARGGRATSSRRILLEVLFEAGISTIYRNLEDLERLGVVVHTHLGHGAATYQLASLAHAHFICEECGAMIEAPDELFRGLARTAKAKFGFTIDPLHFAMLGRCANCVEAGG
jgi:Fe2+ or Zn2+ uptake regulation protein